MRSWRGWSWDDGNFGGSGLEPLDRSLEREGHGRLRDDVRTLPARYPESQAAIDTLDRATVGETWALAHVLYAVDPAMPEAKVAFGQF